MLRSQVQKLRANSALKLFKRCNSNLEFFEPPYLQNLKPKFPVYDAITVQAKGFDFTVLETFQKFAHNIANYMGFNVDTCWPHPGKHYSVNRFKKRSTIAESTFHLIKYERNIKLVLVPGVKLGIYVEVLQEALPEGVELSIFSFDEKHYEDRYVPDHDLNDKMKELNELGGPIEDDKPRPFQIK